jgi:hypothetical protein
MPTYTDDHDLFELMERDLFTAVVGDVMDVMGLVHQFLPLTSNPLSLRCWLPGEQ